MMKRLLALALCLLTVVLPLASCGGSIAMDAEDKGDIINAYITGDIYAFDPGKDITDEDRIQVNFRSEYSNKKIQAMDII